MPGAEDTYAPTHVPPVSPLKIRELNYPINDDIRDSVVEYIVHSPLVIFEMRPLLIEYVDGEQGRWLWENCSALHAVYVDIECPFRGIREFGGITTRDDGPNAGKVNVSCIRFPVVLEYIWQAQWLIRRSFIGVRYQEVWGSPFRLTGNQSLFCGGYRFSLGGQGVVLPLNECPSRNLSVHTRRESGLLCGLGLRLNLGIRVMHNCPLTPSYPGIYSSSSKSEQSCNSCSPLGKKILPVAAILIGFGGICGLVLLIRKIVYRMAYFFPLVFLGFLLCYVLIGYGGTALIYNFAK